MVSICLIVCFLSFDIELWKSLFAKCILGKASCFYWTREYWVTRPLASVGWGGTEGQGLQLHQDKTILCLDLWFLYGHAYSPSNPKVHARYELQLQLPRIPWESKNLASAVSKCGSGVFILGVCMVSASLGVYTPVVQRLVQTCGFKYSPRTVDTH